MARAGRSLHPMGRRADARRRLLIARSREARSALSISTGNIAGIHLEETGAAGLAAVAHILRCAPPATWVFTGDSITHGALYTEGWRSFSEHFGERIRWELRRFGDVVINTGVCGERASGLLKNIVPRVLRFQPEVALILVGTNDALSGPAGRTGFACDLEEIVSQLRESGTIAVLQTPNGVYAPNARTRSDLPAYVDLIRDVAARTESPLVDHWQHWQEQKPGPTDILQWLHDESIHPNYFGHREMARLICRAFGVFDPASFTCRLEVP